MSFVRPQTYKTVADNLGASYAAIRDAIYDSNGDVAFNNMQSSHQLIVEDPDDSAYISESTDPAGSISNDLGTTWFKVGNSDFTEAQAKRIAAQNFATALRRLNSHITTRTGLSTIGSFYSTYAYSADRAAEFNLFVEGDSSSYFTAEFEELSSQLNITIDSQFVQP